MYINSIEITNFRTFRHSSNEFVHQDVDFAGMNRPRPKLPNINLVLGTNGAGKTTLLKAIALAALGPAVGESGIFPYRLVRREPEGKKGLGSENAIIEARFTPHEQDGDIEYQAIESRVEVTRKGDLEVLRWSHPDEKRWHPVYSATSGAFFIVGYGAYRRVEKKEQFDFGSRKISAFSRARRINSLFEESYSLIPLNAWLPGKKSDSAGIYEQVVGLINKLLGEGHYRFQGDMEEGEFLFEKNGLRVPFPALSDGYRAYLGWISDLLYHVCETCPPGKRLVENKGIVMVDEIDLHLHPEWQMSVLPTISKALPNLQFIVTTHSPLIVGSLEWMNIIVMESEKDQSSKARHIETAVHGLDADQILLTEFFGLKSTRASSKTKTLVDLSLKARSGDTQAAKKLLEEMTKGEER